jgi:hypothetical protein
MKQSIILLTYLIIYFLNPFSLSAEGAKSKTITDSKTISKSFTVNPDAEFKLLSRESDVTINTWNQNKVEVKVTLTVEAFEREELDKMLNEMQVSIIGSSTGVDVQSDMCFKQQITTGNKTRIKTGTQTIKIKKYRFAYDIKVPRTNHINIKNSYGNLNLGEHIGRVNLSIYEGSVIGGRMAPSKGVISLKYSDATLGEIKDLDLQGYESEITLGQTTSLNLNAKYSKVIAGKTTDVQLSAYESNITLGFTNQVTGQQNYGSLTIAESKKVTLTCYELKLQTGVVNDLTLNNSKYSNITCSGAGSVSITNAYENDITLGQVVSLSGNTKYCKVDIGMLKKSLHLTGYELKCVINEVSPDFTSVAIDGKYSKVSANLRSGTGYKLTADLNYGQITYPESNFATTKNDNKNTRRVVEGKTKGYTGQSTISVKGFETDVSLAYR